MGFNAPCRHQVGVILIAVSMAGGHKGALAFASPEERVSPAPSAQGMVARELLEALGLDGTAGGIPGRLPGARLVEVPQEVARFAKSHGIVIREIRLLEKTGGKRDYHAEAASGGETAGTANAPSDRK